MHVVGRFLLLWLLAGCYGIAAASGEPATGQPASYDARGVLRSFDAASRRAVIAHEEIAGYMPAMTMTFEVRDAEATPDLLQPGDAVAFRLRVTPENAWIEELHRVKDVSAGRLASFNPAPPAATRELNIGDPLPDGEFVDQNGGTTRLSDFRGQALAITFIYTRCPLPTYCPLMNRNLQTAQDLLTRLDVGSRWHLLSVSVDPAHDTPAVLASFAAGYEADPAHWSFVTSREEVLRRLGAAVGFEFNSAGGSVMHNLRTVVVDTGGRVRKIFRGNEWTPQELVSEVRSALSPIR